jgi:hypothetical protein
VLASRDRIAITGSGNCSEMSNVIARTFVSCEKPVGASSSYGNARARDPLG